MVQTWMDMYGGEHNINWAVACGPQSGIIAIDIDPGRNGHQSLADWQAQYGQLPGTLTSITGGGGYHLFYAMPQGVELRNRNDVLPGVDVRADGGYVLLPPSRHRSGSVYAWRDPADGLIVAMTQALIALVLSSRGPDVELDLASLERIPEGQRNETLFRKACQLRRQTKDDRLAVEASIRVYNLQLCDPPLEEYDLQKLINSAFQQDHVDPELPDWNPVLGGDTPQREMTDTGNGLRIVDYHGEDLRYSQGIGWWRWVGHKWSPDVESQHVQEFAKGMCDLIRAEAASLRQTEENDLADQMMRWAIQTQSAARVAAMMKLATSDPRALVDVDRFDSNPFLLNCVNGTLDLMTGELRPHDKNDLITQCTNIEYEPGFHLDEWERFLFTSCQGDPELIAYLQRAVGYTITGSTAEEAFFLITGPPGSGKSTFIAAVSTAMGDYATAISNETIVQARGGSNQGRREGDLASAFGKRLVSTTEISDGARLDESTIKQLTGGDRVVARHLYKNSFHYLPRFKLWIGTNYAPQIQDQAMWRRVKRIPFNHALAAGERDEKVKRILTDPQLGGKAVLAWAVEGSKQWHARHLAQPQLITDEVHEYHADQDRLADFFAETMVHAPGYRVLVADIYSQYTAWCSMSGEVPFGRPRFTDKLRERPDCIVQRMGGQQYLCNWVTKSSGVAVQAPSIAPAWG